ncbi:MAG TPA: FtsX-like permease family protein [Allosphingosinicella sp.]|nr:FtsX-like permease family protein [Allosphingosinicella sp.]
MWRNYFVVGLRALLGSRMYTLINISGLAIGLAACLTLLLYVRYETRYDAWLPGSENAYQLQLKLTSRQTGAATDSQLTSYVAGRRLKADVPEIDRLVYAHWTSPVVMRGGEAFSGEDSLFVDGNLFDVLRFPFAEGDPATALAQTNSVVLTESEARRIYGTEHAIGRTLTMISRGVSNDYRVTGILRDLPRDSHLALRIVARADFPRWWASQPEFLTSCWDCRNGWNYFTLRPGADPAAVRAGLAAWQRRHVPGERPGDPAFGRGDSVDYGIVNIRDIHLGPAQDGAIKPGNDRGTIATFTIIALLILAMASINFINLATARAGQRAREVALRKVLGARRKQLIGQFIGESLLITAVAMVVALTLVELSLPLLSGLLQADLSLDYFGPRGMLGAILAILLVVGAGGGLYPALFLSRFRPALVLKAGRASAEGAGTGRLRSILVVAQFAVSIGLIVCTSIVYAQTDFARTLDPGFRREGLIQSENLGRRQLLGRTDAIAGEMARVPGIVAVGRSSIGVATRIERQTEAAMPGQAAPVMLGDYAVDAGFFRTMEIRPVAGRLFDPRRAADDATLPPDPDPAARTALRARGANVVINALAARRLGFRDPAAALGREIALRWFGADEPPVPARVIGIVQDSRFRTVRDPIEPIVFRLDRNAAANLLLRYADVDPAAVRARVEQTWRRLAPDVPFDGEYSEERVTQLYGAEQARSRLFAGFALLAVVIACLGLYGLAAFAAERRTREIGIRKVLGARTRDIVRLLVWQFSKPVIIANLIAWPVAWWAMRDWLNGFDARIPLGPEPFLLAGLLALAIATATVAGHALRVARASPIVALRYE